METHETSVPEVDDAQEATMEGKKDTTRDGQTIPLATQIKTTRLSERRSFLGAIGIGLVGSAGLLLGTTPSSAKRRHAQQRRPIDNDSKPPIDNDSKPRTRR